MFFLHFLLYGELEGSLCVESTSLGNEGLVEVFDDRLFSCGEFSSELGEIY